MYAGRHCGSPRLVSSSSTRSSPIPRKACAAERDDLGVQRRIVDAERLDVDLLELAETSGLRLLVAKHRARVPDLQRQLTLPQPVFGHGPHDARGRLGAQRQRAVALVAEGVHLLRDDVGGLPHPALEKRGVLEDGGLDVAVAGQPGRLEQRRDGPRANGAESAGRTSYVPLGAAKEGLTTNRR